MIYYRLIIALVFVAKKKDIGVLFEVRKTELLHYLKIVPHDSLRYKPMKVPSWFDIKSMRRKLLQES